MAAILFARAAISTTATSDIEIAVGDISHVEAPMQSAKYLHIRTAEKHEQKGQGLLLLGYLPAALFLLSLPSFADTVSFSTSTQGTRTPALALLTQTTRFSLEVARQTEHWKT
jgi:hypothetical protein